MRAIEQAFAPAGDEIALAVEHHHRVGSAIEDIDAVLAVDRDGGDIGEIPSLRRPRPVPHPPVTMFPRAENGRHVCFPLELFGLSFRDGPKDQTSDVQLHIGESRDSGFASAMRPGMKYAWLW